MRVVMGLLAVCVACSGDGEPLVDDPDKAADTDVDVDTDVDTDVDVDTDSDVDTDTDADVDTGDTAGGTAGPSAFADCVSVTTYSTTPNIVTSTYDADGWFERVESDTDGNGVTDYTTDYTWQVSATGEPELMEYTDSQGNSGTIEYDARGWPERADYFYPAVGTQTVLYSNTYDVADLITQSVSTSLDTGGVTTTTYDGCELFTRMVMDLDGTGSQVLTSTTTWTVGPACVPQTQVTTSDWAPDVTTTSYDAEGRATSTTSTGGAAPWSSTTTWSCP